jgi:release factor glutamine methyltransferase
VNKIKAGKFKAKDSQAEYIAERREADTQIKNFAGFDLAIFGGVYKASTDTQLMIDTVEILPTQNFLEVGCGCGVIAMALALKAKQGLGVDINSQAIANSIVNTKKYQIANLEFLQSDLFDQVKGKFDVVVCNPPYSNHRAEDEVAKMFWDDDNEMKRRFFEQVGSYLLPGGVIYFGWADFADIDVNLPFELAEKNGFKVVDISKKKSNHRNYSLFVLKIQRV